MIGRRGLRGYFRLRPDEGRLASHVEEEVRLHLEMRVAQLMARGRTEVEARHEAERRFGIATGAQQQLVRAARKRERRMSAREWLGAWRQDLQYSVRSLAREPQFSLMVIVTLALGIGANAAMFGIIDRLLLSGPAHVVDAERIKRLFVTTEPAGMGAFTTGTVGYVSYALLRDHTDAFEHVAAHTERSLTLGSGERAREVRVGYATWDYFPLLGTRPLLGRFFLEEEDEPDDARDVAVISESLWRTEYGGSADVLGQRIDISAKPYTIVGVAPAGFTGTRMRPVVAWLPMSTHPAPVEDWPAAWNAQWLSVIGRLRPGVDAELAAQQATAAYRNAYTGEDEVEGAAQLSLRPLRYLGNGEEGPHVRIAKWLSGVSLVVLLIACANVANLMLARALRRRREIGVRLALGITRQRLVRLLLSDSLLLAIASGVAALGVAHWGGAFIGTMLVPDALWTGAAIPWDVVGVSAGLVIAVALAIGLLPALQASRHDVSQALRTGMREGGGRRGRLRASLTIAQAALSVILLVGAGLFVRSLARVNATDLGIEPERVTVVHASWPPISSVDYVPGRTVSRSAPEEVEAARAVERARRGRVMQDALEHIRGMPEIEAAAIAIGTPFNSWFSTSLRVPGYDSIPRLAGGGPYLSAVTSDYFTTMGVDIVRGRAFTDADRAGSEAVAIVNQTMANTLWPGETAIGKCIMIGQDAPDCARIVGIAENARRSGFREEESMQYYVPWGQERGIGGNTLLVRARGENVPTDALRKTLFSLDPLITYVNAYTLADDIAPELRPWRVGATLFSLFGALALLIAAVGLYSVIAYGVTQRRTELGVRMALGARNSDVVRMVVGDGLKLAAIGTAAGMLISIGASRYLENMLYETSTRDSATLAGVVTVLLAVSILSSLLPALRASRIDPIQAVRGD